MKLRIFYEIWEMECCGKPFSIGDTVRWQAREIENCKLDTPFDIGRIDYCYEAHDSFGISILEGTVDKIKILYEISYPSKEQPLETVYVDSKLVDADRVDGSEDYIGDFRPTAYIVELVECKVTPTEDGEVP